ncbi:MAG: DUF1571 domain-containing protein [Cyclobacteriaceae bacterium]
MRIHHLAFAVVAIAFLASFNPPNEEVSGHSITQEMFSKTSEIRSVIYNLTKHERIDGELIKQVSFNKVNKEPFKVYLKQLYPKEGLEVLYANGVNNNKALVNPNGFPWINLKLNPHDGIMRKNQHHTILQAGFDHVLSILMFLCEKHEAEIDNIIEYEGLVDYEGEVCHSISLNNPYFKYIDYTVRENETVIDIASRLKLSEYMIVEKNPKVKDYEDVEAGQVIQIPTDYSPKMLLYVYEQNMLPARMDIYDDKGLYEKYEFSSIVVNPNISPDEFSEEFEGYGF